MSAIPYETPDPDVEIPQDSADQEPPFAPPPGRRRPRFFNRKTAVLGALVTCAAGFFGGVQVEKSQLSTAAAATSPSTGAGAAAAGAGSGRAGFAFGGGAGAGTFGTVSSVSGNTLYVTEASGNAIKVTVSSATKLTKNQSVSKSSVRPGDSVVIQGATNSSGTIAATSVSDSGTRTAGTGASSTAGTGTTTGTGSATSSPSGATG